MIYKIKYVTNEIRISTFANCIKLKKVFNNLNPVKCYAEEFFMGFCFLGLWNFIVTMKLFYLFKIIKKYYVNFNNKSFMCFILI